MVKSSDNKDKSADEKILKAAKKIFIAKGLDGARMQDIANEAGINKALLHYYFKSKEKLFEIIFQEAFSNFQSRINSILESELTLSEKIETFCGEYIDHLIENPFMPLFVLNEINKQPSHFVHRIRDGKRNGIERFLKQVDAEVSQKLIRKVEPVQLLINMISLCIFPFVSKPMIQLVAGLTEDQFKVLMEKRKKEIPEFIIASLQK